MSDDERRELERRIRQGADPADEARWLTERVRHGALPAARLELAAYLGHPAARVALGAEPPAADDDAVLRWRQALDAAGRDALVRAAIGALRSRLGDVPSPRAQLVEALGLLEAWVKEPTAERAAMAMHHEPTLARRQEALAADGRLDAAGFARRAQDATRALATVVNDITWGYDPFAACLRDLRDAGAAARPLVTWALA